MKKRFISVVCTFAIMLSMLAVSNSDVIASEGEKYNGSSLTTQESSVGQIHSEITTRGTYLMDGECSITKSGRGRIYVYASTTANIEKVDYLSTVIYVDRYNADTKDWGQIAFWQVEDTDTYYVSTSKTMVVDRGYYYRVRATHVAGMRAHQPYDEATSFTDGIWID